MNQPKSYTECEGGSWLDWTGGPIDGRSLNKRAKTTVEIQGVRLHSLWMTDGRQWDCINGWRPENKCKECGRKEGEGHYDDCPIGLGVRKVPPPACNPAAQAYADRVWAGQSISESRQWRMQRVKDALEGQGLSMEGVVLPN